MKGRRHSIEYVQDRKRLAEKQVETAIRKAIQVFEDATYLQVTDLHVETAEVTTVDDEHPRRQLTKFRLILPPL